MSIGSVIKDRRIALNLKQEDVADKVGVTVQTYGKWENDKTEPKASQVAALSKILRVSERDICSGERTDGSDIDPITFMRHIASARRLIDDVSYSLMIYDHMDDPHGFIATLESELKKRHGFGVKEVQQQEVDPSDYDAAVGETQAENSMNEV